MKNIITIDRLKVYNDFGGDIDGFLRTNSKKYIELFGDESDRSWATISSKLQDIELISKRLSSQDYTSRTLKELKEICDVDSFKSLMKCIPFYEDFTNISRILNEIKQQINTRTDTVWAGFDSVDLFLDELNRDIENIELCNFATLNIVNVEFAVTSTYQELSISNGWSATYLKLAEEFDEIYERITTNNYPTDNKNKWWKFW